MAEWKKGDIVKLTASVGGTYLKWGTQRVPESCIPDGIYVVLNKTRDKAKLAVQLDMSCRPRPSSKHIYEISKRNFILIDKHCP